MDLLRDAWSPFHEALFRCWKQGGEKVVRSELEVQMRRNGRFLRYALPFKYDYFGSIETSPRALQPMYAK